MADDVKVTAAELKKQLAKELRAAQKEEEQAAAQLLVMQQNAERAKNTSAFLGPIFSFMEWLKQEPREILEARFAHELGFPCPANAPHVWLWERVARHRQRALYAAAGRGYPTNLERKENILARMYLKYDAEEVRRKDPAPHPSRVDATVRVRATSNPFARGDAWSAQQLVIMATEAHGGVTYADLRDQFVAVLQDSVPTAEARALRYFTDHARDGRCALTFVQPETRV